MADTLSGTFKSYQEYIEQLCTALSQQIDKVNSSWKDDDRANVVSALQKTLTSLKGLSTVFKDIETACIKEKI